MENQERAFLLENTSCSGQRGHYVQDHQEARQATQKQSFSRWINIHLKRCEPPMEIRDLFSDVQDGHILMALLEVLSGCKMLYRFRPSSHRIFRLNNIAKVLTFLEDRNVKCKSIDASDVADGIPSVVLGLIWNIIVLFHIKKSTRNIQQILSTNSAASIDTSRETSSISTSAMKNDRDLNTFPSKRRKSSATSKYRGTAIKTLLRWARTCTSKYDVEVRDFGKSWRSGLAFLALIKSINPALVDMRTSLTKTQQENVEEAFRIAHNILGIPSLLDFQDVTTRTPDEQSIITYVTQFLEYKLNLDEVDDSAPYAKSYDINTYSSDGLCSPLSSLEKYPSITEPVLFTSEKSTCSLLESSIEPNDVFGTCSTEGYNSGNSFPVKGTGRQACAVDIRTLSLSSEEGVYTLPALDSEEEEAYRYILALDEEANEDCRPDSGFQLVMNVNEHDPTLCICPCREVREVRSKNENEGNFGNEQTLIEPKNEAALGENQRVHADHDGFFPRLPVEGISGHNICHELLTAGQKTTGADRVEYSTEESSGAAEASQRREDVPSSKVDGDIKVNLSEELESLDHNNGIVPSDVTNGKHIVEDDKSLDWGEQQMDNCALINDGNGDTDLVECSEEENKRENGMCDHNNGTLDTEDLSSDVTNGKRIVEDDEGLDSGEKQMDNCALNNDGSGHTDLVECSEEEEENKRESGMCDILRGEGEVVEMETRLNHRIEDLGKWECDILSNEIITLMNTDSTREGTLFSRGMGACCSTDTEELHLLMSLWILTYCLFIIPQLDICQYFLQ